MENRILPHKLHPPYLQGDDRGGNVACQNITMFNASSGEVIRCHMAEPASLDPLAPVNIVGKFQERVMKERQQVKPMCPNSPNT